MSTSIMMSVAQVCAYTGLSKTTVFKLIKERQVDVVKILGRTLISRTSVEALCGQPAVPSPRQVEQPGISKLPPPPVGYQVDKDTRRDDGVIKFETPSQCREEDRVRARRLRRTIQKSPDEIDVREARKLATALERSGETGDNPESPASSLYMGDQRRRIIGALWKLLAEDGS